MDKADLISRKAAIAFANDKIEKETGEYSKGRNTGLRVMKSALNNPDAIPFVEAVPLEPLCQWLAGYAAPPNYALDKVRDDSIDPESLVYTANDRAKAWEYHFRELLKAQDVPDTNAGEWISVKDRMPEYNGEYIVHFSASDAVLSAYYFKNQGGFRVGANIVTDSVLHWMPLPEPPKEEQNAAD